MIIYLHGFRSGPQSWKSRSLKARMDALGIGEAFWCEQLPVAAPEAIALAEAQIARSSTPPEANTSDTISASAIRPALAAEDRAPAGPCRPPRATHRG